MTFGEYLHSLRDEKGLRQTDLAQTIGVSSVYVCDIEKGRRYPPSLDKLQVWVKQLGLSPDEIELLYDLAGNARNCPAPDIMAYLDANPEAKQAIRRIMGQHSKYDWEKIPSRR